MAEPGCRAKIGHLPEGLAPQDEQGAYVIQDALHEVLLREGTLGPIVGTKIGCTTPVMQEYLGMAHPCCGAIFGATVQRGRGRYEASRLWRPGVECEIAVQLRRALGPLAGGRPHTRQSVGGAVGSVTAAIELVDDRYQDFERREPDWPVWVADDFFGAGAVLGQGGLGWHGEEEEDEELPWMMQQGPGSVDLSAVEGEMRINGQLVGSGRGRDIIAGHPFEALAWLANHRAAQGRGLASGEVVLLGSVVQTRWLEAGDVVEVAISQLGTASLQLLP